VEKTEESNTGRVSQERADQAVSTIRAVDQVAVADVEMTALMRDREGIAENLNTNVFGKERTDPGIVISREIPDPHTGLDKPVQLKNDPCPTSGDNRSVLEPEVKEVANDVEELGTSREEAEERDQVVLLASFGCI
jgi:hypothetical protein